MLPQDETNILYLLREILADKYHAEFKVEDGQNQHRQGLTFNRWVVRGYGIEVARTLRLNV